MNDHILTSPGGISLEKYWKSLIVANQNFSRIKEKYPQLNAYVVLALGAGQSKIENKDAHIFMDLPDIFLNSRHVIEARNLFREIHLLEIQNIVTPHVHRN